MDSKQRRIKDYVRKITNNVVNLNETHLTKIIEIATGSHEYTAVLHRWNYQLSEFTKQRQTRTTEEKYNKVLAKYGDNSTNGFYRWDVYAPDGRLLKQFFSINANLF